MFTLQQLAEKLDAEIVGDPACEISNVCTLQNGQSGCISFLANPKYKKYLQSTTASAVLVNAAVKDLLNTNGLVVSNPYVAYAKVASWLHPFENPQTGVHPSAVVATTATIDPSAWVGPQCVIGEGVHIGPGCYIGPACVVEANVVLGEFCRLVANVTLCHEVQVGQRVILHPGVVIGADGFGIAQEGEHWLKIPQVGSVILGDDVEVGANTTIDRGAIENTIIENGVKLDNLIQVGHNVRIGEHTVVVASAAIAGSTRIGRCCAIGGQAGIVGHVEITDNVTITAKTFVMQSIKEPGVYSSGVTAETNEKWRKNSIRFRQLDDMARKLKQLERVKDKK
ncbi:MAG: UDP-3-O-(3-hydroxymyristoyl)glucosamine N-acyltransferase [Gammaproteobacteria bacterium]|nr:UDP-3-O-(3-hydroxymyristoyl)glucosamine N-acyltransferase [Gammaproteobacteria bacterium]MDH5802788.1 UDP-3-O-(3-hydroxymyristoyl)glucosamine N-acyltransferase [Gammaproteobacteria bacterium]